MRIDSIPRAVALTVCLALATTCFTACKPAANEAGTGGSGSGETPATFTLAWSEYPSWSVFGVADELGLIDGDAGKMGTLEKEHGVDIELKEATYDSCLTMFSSGECDAVCITNMDALIVGESRRGVAVLPTSTSNGADACLVTEAVTDIEALKNVNVYGLVGTVSQYCFARCLEQEGFNEAEFKFTNQDPGIAAQRMQQKTGDSPDAIMVWNPFVLQTLQDRPDVRVLFDSSKIPGEIVDMVVVGTDVMEQPEAAKFVKAVAAAFYGVNEAIEDPESGDEVLVALGKKFSNLELEAMKKVVEQTVFYKSSADAKSLLTGDEFKSTMETVTKFCIEHDLVKQEPLIGYGADSGEVTLKFDASYLD